MCATNFSYSSNELYSYQIGEWTEKKVNLYIDSDYDILKEDEDDEARETSIEEITLEENITKEFPKIGIFYY